MSATLLQLSFGVRIWHVSCKLCFFVGFLFECHITIICRSIEMGVRNMKKKLGTFATGLSIYLCLSVSVPAQDWFQTGQEADIVLGPYEGSGGPSALHHPSRACADTTSRLFVADTRNNRVLIWNRYP